MGMKIERATKQSKKVCWRRRAERSERHTANKNKRKDGADVRYDFGMNIM